MSEKSLLDASDPEPKDEYDLFSRYYELDQGDFTDDIPLYLNIAQQCGSPIFEFGCGTGRIAIALARAGYHVTGIDVASTMLALARQKIEDAGLSERITLVQSDMRSPAVAGGFALGLCPLNTLMHMYTLGDQLAVLQSAHRLLRSGGVFVIDLPNPHRSTLSEMQTPLLLEKEFTDPRTGHRILKLFSQRGNLATQVADVTLIYDEIDERGRVHRTLVPFHLRWLYPYEGRLLMEIAGFYVDQFYGSYDLEPFGPSSERMIIVGRVP